MPQDHRFFVTLTENGRARLSDRDRHHVEQVLRLRRGDSITAVDNRAGRAFVASLGDEGEIILGQELISAAALKNRIRTLCFALCKGDHNELIIEKATELGVENIALFHAERSLPTFESAHAKLERWNRIAEAAAKQCHRLQIPSLQIFPALGEFLASRSTPECALVVASLEKGAAEARSLPDPNRQVDVVIGPEGDLSPAEYQQIHAHRGIAITLGPTILRSETAAIVAIAMLQGVWGSTLQ
jgi:16S rRNA (uracil1498-N3)-methyltransferase